MNGPEHLGFFLVPNFSLLSFAAVTEPLRMANRLNGVELYGWRLFTQDDEPVTASNGMIFAPTGWVEEVDRVDTLIVVAGLFAHLYRDPKREAWLRHLARQGLNIGATSTGSLILARAGLLDNHRCTIHWENLAGFQEEFPYLKVTSELFEIDGRRLTCSGGTAGLDMMLHLIGLRHGQALANAVAEQCIHPHIRNAHEQQRMTLRARFNIAHPQLLAIITQMEAHLEDVRSCEDMAESVGLSLRQLERLFQKYLQITPVRFYLELRLERAQTLLQQTALSVLDVATACGFVSASHFTKCYREHFGKTPREERVHIERIGI